MIQSSWFDIIGEYWIFLFTNLTKHLHTSFKILPPTIKQLFFYQKKTPLQIFASIMISEMSLMSTLLCSNYFMVFYTIVKSALLVGDSKNEKIQNFFISSKISKSLWYDKTPIICYKFIHRKVLHLWDYKECPKQRISIVVYLPTWFIHLNFDWDKWWITLNRLYFQIQGDYIWYLRIRWNLDLWIVLIVCHQMAIDYWIF